jgi:predicted transcriptional regulator
MEMAMNRIEIEVLSSQAALAAFTRAWRQTRARRKTTPRLAFGSIAELFSAVSEKRLELIRHVAGDEGLQMRPLARALGRDYKNVHTDVQALIELGLLEKRVRRPARAFRRNRDSDRPAQGRVSASTTWQPNCSIRFRRARFSTRTS